MTAAAARRLSLAARILAAVVGGYAYATLLVLAAAALLPLLGIGRPEALLVATIAAFPIFAGIVMAVFHARSARRAWLWLAIAAVPPAAAVALLLVEVGS
ncbi:DUF3649 domain-containing protein [Marinibaculum pumilum]|uniref:DUF3649 domain-containing protein n=1 Tax=Marinibaculum pumilum TaxID=1766165 RepID=A0ABV7KWH9_9PROT